MPVLGSTAYPQARGAMQFARALLNDANINANAPVFIASIVRAGGVVTVNTVGPHGLLAGSTPDQVTVLGVLGGATNFNGVFSVASVTSSIQFTYAQVGGNEAGTASTGTVSNIGQGALWTDAVLLPYMNAGYRKVQRALENVGQPGPIRDDVLLVVAAIPGNPDPSLEVSITDSTAPPNQLPVDLLVPLKLWERPNGTSQEFMEMTDMTNKGGLPSRFQEQTLNVWEWRSDGLFFLGATVDTQIRLKYRGFYADMVDGSSAILIRNSQDAIAFAAVGYAAHARGSPKAAEWAPLADDAIEDLISRATRQNQRSGTRRRPFSSRSGWSPF